MMDSMVAFAEDELRPGYTTEYPTRPGADLPPDTNLFWYLMHPGKDKKGNFPIDHYSQAEKDFWGISILALNGALENEADNPQNPDNPLVVRIRTPKETHVSHAHINATIRELINDNPSFVALELLQGALADWIELYNDPNLRRTSAVTQIFTAIVAGTNGNHVSETGIQTTLPVEHIKQASAIIIHDDVGDKMAALAVAVEKITTLRNPKHAYDAVFVRSFSDDGISDNNRKDLYGTLIEKMRDNRIVAAIPVYKNNLFIDMLEQSANYSSKQELTLWGCIQTKLLSCRIDNLHEWIMGDGPDTGIPMNMVLSEIPKEILTHPSVASLLKHVADSEIRLGSTISGIIALKDGQFDRLVQWVTIKIQTQLETVIANTPVRTTLFRYLPIHFSRIPSHFS